MLDNGLYQKFVELIWQRTGLFYESSKKYYVEKRLEKRVEDLKLRDFKEYYQFLKFTLDPREFDQLINDLTVNETYFFRDFPQLQNFAEEVLPILVKKKERQGDNSLKIWSAACSTGEEPYTLAIILLEMLDRPDKWLLDILASDINGEVLAKAQRALYGERSVKDVPLEYLQKYFTLRNGNYLVNMNVRNLVRFRQINFMDSQAMGNQTGYDVIFCRNSLIYFNDQSRRKVIEYFYHSLNPGGYIFLGHSESIGRISSAFKVEKTGNTIVYSKP